MVPLSPKLYVYGSNTSAFDQFILAYGVYHIIVHMLYVRVHVLYACVQTLHAPVHLFTNTVQLFKYYGQTN